MSHFTDLVIACVQLSLGAYFRHLSFWQDEVVTYLDRMLRDPLWVGSNEPFLGSGNAAGRWYRT